MSIKNYEPERVRSRRICDSIYSDIQGNICNLRPRRVLLEEPTAFYNVKARYRLECPANNEACAFKIESDPGMCVPWCELCGGTGRVMHQANPSDANFGRSYQCPNKVYGWSESQTGISLEEYNRLINLPLGKTKPMVAMLETVSPVLERGWGYVYIWGPYGLGKTMLGQMAVIRSIKLKRSGAYWRHNKVIDWLREAYDLDHGQMEYKNRLALLANLDCLVLDELGRDRGTELSKQSLSAILDDRYRKSVDGTGICIVLSNDPPEDTLDGYLVDRFLDQRSAVVSVAGNSLRAIAQELKTIPAEKQLPWWHK